MYISVLYWAFFGCFFGPMPAESFDWANPQFYFLFHRQLGQALGSRLSIIFHFLLLLRQAHLVPFVRIMRSCQIAKRRGGWLKRSVELRNSCWTLSCPPTPPPPPPPPIGSSLALYSAGIRRSPWTNNFHARAVPCPLHSTPIHRLHWQKNREPGGLG